MMILIRSEFIKLKREKFLFIILLMTLMPVITGFLGMIKNNREKNAGEMYFFINNQHIMFFPIVLVILIGSIFYIEYKNDTYINWISYDYSKTSLFFAKSITGIIIGFILNIILYLFFILSLALLIGFGRISGSSVGFLEVTKAFLIENIILIPISIMFGAIMIILSRNIIVTSIIGVVYGFISVLFIGTDFACYVPSGFAYRLSMSIIDKEYYFENASQATYIGIISSLIFLFVFIIVNIFLFTHKKKIEG